MPPKTIANFGRNVEFLPAEIIAPRTEQELLAALARYKGRKIRAVGRLHSWSEAIVADDVLVDLRHFKQVDVEQHEDRHWLTVGAGCQIKRLLAELHRQNAGTLPSLGLVTEQTIAGGIATATHGSGRHSMSHYIDEVRVAAYDAMTGEPVVRVVRDGAELKAARCSLGAMGIILSVGFWSRPQYNIEEHFAHYETLDEVLSKEADFPLQQFYFMPWSWSYFAQHRREVAEASSRLAALYHWYFFLTFDVLLHLAILLVVRVLHSARAVRLFFKHVAPRLVIKNWRVVDKSQNLLIMEHELFRHVEIEIFIRRSLIRDALDVVVALLRHFGDQRSPLSELIRERLQLEGHLAEVDRLGGTYTHHYPICIRRVLPDDTLVSMTSGMNEPCYAISFISYARPHERSGFFAFASILCKILATLFDGRPHWGKICPLSSIDAARLYPDLVRFREVCTALDPSGAFRNRWIEQLIFQERPATA